MAAEGRPPAGGAGWQSPSARPRRARLSWCAGSSVRRPALPGTPSLSQEHGLAATMGCILTSPKSNPGTGRNLRACAPDRIPGALVAAPGAGPGPGPARSGREQRRGRGGAVREAKETPIGKRPPASLRAAAGKHRGTPPPARPPPPAAPPVYLPPPPSWCCRAGGRRPAGPPAASLSRWMGPATAARRRPAGQRLASTRRGGGARRRALGHCRPLVACSACPAPPPPAFTTR